MNNDKLAQFANQKYLNLESYRRNGQEVRTPLWFVEDGGALYFYTVAHSYKVKRIGANPRVRVAPCDMRGALKGEWVDATARRLDEAEARRANELLNRKYGLAKRILNFLAKIRGHERAAFVVRLN
ncbi:MAG TPA: PPOX class F420-dependent oxidoreductase [Blastocatellia bacterium]|nr:PPOX class F420-dependent oxidoreductase [Blastocatellia bacterium]